LFNDQGRRVQAITLDLIATRDTLNRLIAEFQAVQERRMEQTE
jgi:hypothetical protein